MPYSTIIPSGPIKNERTQPEKVRHRELAEKLSQNTGIKVDDAMLMLKALPFCLVDSLQVEGDKVMILNIGTWEVKSRAGKMDMLSSTTETVKGRETTVRHKIKRRDKTVITFHAAKNFIPYVEQEIRDA